MGDSWAYSDSVFDVPLLSAVGHPHAVNPDPRLRVVAGLRRWPVRWLDVPPGVPKLAGLEPSGSVDQRKVGSTWATRGASGAAVATRLSGWATPVVSRLAWSAMIAGGKYSW